MAEPLSPEEMAAEQQAQADEARRIASAYLQSTSAPVASFPGDVPPPPDPVPVSAPADASPPPNGTWEAAKKGAIKGLSQAGKMMLLGPISAGADALHGVASGLKQDTPPVDASIPGNDVPSGPSAPPTPVVSTKETPTFLPSYTGAGSTPRLVSPAGMRPESNEVSVQQGIAVPEQAKSAMDSSFGHALEAADTAHDANQSYGRAVQDQLQQRMAAEDAARIDHAKVAAQRQAVVDQKMAEIQSLNQQAQADIDPDKYWHDRGAFARVLGVIAGALGGFSAGLTGGPNNALNIIENGINREVDAQKFNKQNARSAADQAEKGLNLNLKALGDRDQAIDATKASLFANVATMLDSEAARRGIAMDDANLALLKQGLAEKQADYYNKVALQETDKIAKQSKQRWAPAVYAGGGPAADKAHELPDNIITIPASDHTGNKEVHVAVPKDLHTVLATSQGATNAFSAQAKEALDIRRQLREASAKGDADAVRTYWKRLQSLNTDRVKSIEKTRDPSSSVREGEFAIEAAKGVNYTDGLIVPEVGGFNSGRLLERPGSGDVDKNIQSSVNRAQQQTDERIRGATGQIVHQQVGRDKNGNVFTQWAPTGQLYEGRAVMPEKKQVGK